MSAAAFAGVLLGLGWFSPVARAAAGDLDTTFNSTGKVATAIAVDDYANAVAIQPDGKIVAAGTSTNGSQYGFALTRYNPDGSLDTTFNTTGKVTTTFGSGTYGGTTTAVAIQPDGKIVAAGSSTNGSQNVFSLSRHNADGSLDTTFNGTGKVTTAIGVDAYANAVAIQPDGKIVAAGTSTNGSQYGFALTRYNPDGCLDTTFNSTGKVATAIGVDDYANAVAIQPDGKIVAAGTSTNGSQYGFALTRYNSDGSLDTTFNTTGKVITTFGSGGDTATAVAIQPDGKMVAAGRSYNGSQLLFALTRYNTDGALDTTFHLTGKVITSIGLNDYASSMVIQPDGKIVAAGASQNSTQWLFALVRYNSDGSIDTTFNNSGMITTAIGSVQDFASSVAIQPDGKIVAAGSSYDDSGTRNRFALARYLGDPPHSVTYDGNGNTGGSVPTDGHAYATGATVTVFGNTGSLVKTGYTFAGWNTAANGSGTSYAGGATFAIGSGNVMLYAKWILIPTYSVTYNGNTNTGGTVPVDSIAYVSGATVTVLGNTGTLVKTGYTFAGWSTAANGSGTSYAGGATFAMGSGNVMLYAKWITVTILSNGGAVNNISGAFGTMTMFQITVPAGASNLRLVTSGGSGGDVDIFARFNALPTVTAYDAKSDGPTRNETITIATPQGGTYYLLLYGDWSNYVGVTLVASYNTAAVAPPASPTGVVATAGNAQASVSFTAPASDGGRAITGYTVISNPAGGVDVNAGSASLTHIVIGLTNGISYAFTATATNAAGLTSVPSSPSNSVTPNAPTSPDLVVTTLTAPSTGTIGRDIFISATVANQGTATAGPYRIGFYLSADATITTGDTLTIGCAMSALAPGASGDCAGPPIIPASLSPGTYYVGAFADDLGTVSESNELNNTAATQISLSLAFTLPSAPFIGTAIAANASVSVAFTPDLIGSGTLDHYTAACGGVTSVGNSSPIVVNGLTNGVTYTCQVRTTSSVGDSPWSGASNSVIPATVPDAPAIQAVTAGSGRAPVSFGTPGSNGGSAITAYTATCTATGYATRSASGSGSPITVLGLVGGVAYSCSVIATNGVGSSAPSATIVVAPLKGISIAPILMLLLD